MRHAGFSGCGITHGTWNGQKPFEQRAFLLHIGIVRNGAAQVCSDLNSIDVRSVRNIDLRLIRQFHLLIHRLAVAVWTLNLAATSRKYRLGRKEKVLKVICNLRMKELLTTFFAV